MVVCDTVVRCDTILGRYPMLGKRSVARKHIQYHKDGTIWAKGQTVNGVVTGYWEWFRTNGTKMRSRKP